MNRAQRRVRRSPRAGKAVMLCAALSVAALAGMSLASAGGSPQAHIGTARLDAAVTRTSAPAPSPAEGHSPKLTQQLSGPLSGTGAARPGSSARISAGMRQATAAAASTMLNGVDVSSAQHSNNAAINWTSVAGAGYNFAGIKATEGNYYTNPFYASDATAATAAGMYVSAYAFANPYGSTSATPPNGTAQQQADYAWQNAGDYTVGGQYLPMMLDIEYDPYTGSETNSNECYGLSTTAMVNWITSFMDEATTKTGAAPIIYTTQDWWHTCTGDSTKFGSDVLWVASYASGTPGTLPAGWSTWNMWQYTSTGTVPGISPTGKTDLDYFSGAPETEQTPVNKPVSIPVRTLNSLAGDNVTYTATGLPPGVTISSSGQITGTPTKSGAYNVTVTPSASDAVLPASVSFSWTVQGTMTVTSPGDQTTTAGSAVDLKVSAADPAVSDTPSFTAAGLPPGLSISSAGLISGWPYQPGTYSTTVTATDSAGAASATFSWTVSQAANSGPTGQVVVQTGGKCLDDTARSTANGNPIEIWDCNGGANQKWTVAQDGTLRIYGKCLDVTGGGTANGTKMQLYTCQSGDANQQWRVGTDAELVNPKSGRCLDDTAHSTTNGTQVEIWDCNAGANQRWTLPAGPVASGVAGKCLDDTAHSTANGNKIEVWDCNGGTAQNWTVEPDGTVRVYGKCLDVTGHGTASGTKIQLYTCLSGDTAQQWQVNPTAQLAGEFVNPASGMCLADPGDSATNGTQLVIQSCSATDPGDSWHL